MAIDPHPEEDLLVQRYAEHPDDQLPLEELWHHYVGYFQAIARGRFRNPSDVEDALQQCFLKLSLLATRAQFRLADGSSWAAWASRVVRNQCLDLGRRMDTSIRSVEPESAGGLDIHRGTETSVLDSLIEDETRTNLTQAVRDCIKHDAGLTDEQKDVIIEIFLHERRATTVAREKGKGDSRISNQKSIALEKLRDCLQQKGFGE